LFQPTPPQYNLANFNVPTVFYTGNKDMLADPKDVAWLKDQVKNYLVADINTPEWGHLDFIWDVDAVDHCYNDLINRLFQ
jgi:pimeloyl-ACP methyl ester carboxylesterase